jgi:hypothetical protein
MSTEKRANLTLLTVSAAGLSWRWLRIPSGSAPYSTLQHATNADRVELKQCGRIMEHKKRDVILN